MKVKGLEGATEAIEDWRLKDVMATGETEENLIRFGVCLCVPSREVSDGFFRAVRSIQMRIEEILIDVFNKTRGMLDKTEATHVYCHRKPRDMVGSDMEYILARFVRTKDYSLERLDEDKVVYLKEGAIRLRYTKPSVIGKTDFDGRGFEYTEKPPYLLACKKVEDSVYVIAVAAIDIVIDDSKYLVEKIV